VIVRPAVYDRVARQCADEQFLWLVANRKDDGKVKFWRRTWRMTIGGAQHAAPPHDRSPLSFLRAMRRVAPDPRMGDDLRFRVKTRVGRRGADREVRRNA